MPFRARGAPGTVVQVTRAETLETLRLEVRDAPLRRASTAEAATTLIVLSPRSVRSLGAATFEGFMEGARVVAREARRLTESLPKETRAALDLGQGDVIEIVPFHPAATSAPRPTPRTRSGRGYICTCIEAMTTMTMMTMILVLTKPRCAR